MTRSAGRWTRRIAVVVTASMALSTGVPVPNILGVPDGGLPLSWISQLLRAPAAWAESPRPPTPKQQGGSAKGKAHYVGADQTRATPGKKDAKQRTTGGRPGTGAGEVPAESRQRRQVTPTTTTVAPGRDRFDPATSRRLAGESSATSDVYANADGSYTRKVYPGPVNYRVADGTWSPIDTTLARGGDGRLRQQANALGTELAGGADDPSLVSVRIDANRSVTYRLAGAARVPAETTGATATYRGVLADTDLELTTLAAGVKEALILHSPRAVNTWTFPLTLRGVTPRIAGDGSVEFVGADGAVAAVIPPGIMRDSKIDPRSAEAAESRAITYELVTTEGGPALRMTADAGWLTDPARVYPVTVDPTFSTRGSTYVQTGVTGSNAGDTQLKIGTYNAGSTKARTFLSFAGFGSSYAGNRLTSVNLKLFNIWAYRCGHKDPFQVRPVTQAWATSVAWPGPTFGDPIGTGELYPSAAACSNTTTNRNVGAWMSVPLNVATFNSWTAGGTNYGLAVTASESDSTQWKKFASINTTQVPHLSFDYAADTPPQVDTQFPPDGHAVESLTPQLLAAGHDADAWPSGGVQYLFTLYDDAGTKITDSGRLATGAWTVPATTLAWGKTYLWTVQTYDGYTYSSPVYHRLRTPVPQPLITSGLAQNGEGNGVSPSIGNYTTSATDAQVATIGPELAVRRDYNSRDPRRTGAFGAGWSSLVDATAAEQLGPDGTVSTVVVTYPTGQQVAFGRNSDNTFIPPQGRFATFTAESGGGYTLTDKNNTVYRFTQPTGTSGVFGLTAVADANGRTQTLTYTGGRVTTVRSASGRTLSFTWDTPAGTGNAHVTRVVTDSVVAGDATSALTWTYTYTGDHLSKVCPPTSATACTTYTAQAGSQYPTTVLDIGPRSYWRLGEAAGTTAASAVLTNAGTDAATYTDVTLGQPGPLPGSAATAAGFNGTSSQVALPTSLVANGSYQSVSLWFKTTTANGVLFSYQADPITNGTTPANYTPALYVGASGKLHGEFWYAGGTDTIVSPTAVTDGAWHHVVLSGAGNTQTMYLDGAPVGTKSGLIQMFTGGSVHNYVGAGFIGNAWPDHASTGSATGVATYFTGSIAEVAFSNQAISARAAAAMYTAGHTSMPLLSKVYTPAGRTAAEIGHDPVTGTVRQVTDADGGVWKLGTPTVSGSSQVYAGAVLGAPAADYWRLGESGGASDAANQVNNHWGRYSSVTQGVVGAFGEGEDTAAAFNGTSSSMEISNASTASNGTFSAELWFTTTKAPGILLGYQETPLGSGWSVCSPAIYIGTDGKLYGGLPTSTGLVMNTSTGTVTDGKWHHVVLTAENTSVSLYLDGALVRTTTGGTVGTSASYVYVGAGHSATLGPGLPNQTDIYFTGSIDEVALYQKTLSAAEVTAHYQAARSATGTATALTVPVTDPGAKTVTDVYDATNGNRLVAHTDALGNTTRYGYDVEGYLHTVTDPNGNVTTTGHDVRGNVVSKTTCESTLDKTCSTTYYTYAPDATTKVLKPNPLNDVLLTTRDGRSSSATDNAYLTSMTYDEAGNRIAVTTPPVDGYPTGRTTTTTYTTAATPAVGGGTTPPGLPLATTSPGGAKQTIGYYANGDIATVTDPAGLLTRFVYDGLGRPSTVTVVSDTYPNGLATTFTYDGLGRTLTTTKPAVTNRVTGAVHTAKTTTVYDADSHVLSTTVADLTGGDAARTTSSTYDDYGRPATVTDAAGAITTFGYDSYGHRTRQLDAEGNDLRFAFDANGHLLTTTLKGYTGDPANPSTAKDLVLESRAYDPAGRLASVTDSMGRVTEYSYYDNNLLCGIDRVYTSTSGEETWFNELWNFYDGAGHVYHRHTNDWQTHIDYEIDAAGRTTAEIVDWGGLHRTTRTTYSADDAVLRTTLSDQSSTVSITDATYDPAGRMTSRTVYATGGLPTNGWWKLDEASGTTAADSSGLNRPATLSGGASLGGGAASFDGTTGKAETAGPVLNTTTSFTVSAWARPTALDGSRTILAQDATVNSAFTLAYSEPDDRWGFSILAEDSEYSGRWGITSTAAPTLDSWAHLVATFEDTAGYNEMALYVDGTKTDELPYVGALPSAGPFTIGRSKYNEEDVDHFAGQIDNVQVYPRRLSDTEIAALHAGGRSGGALPTTKLTTTWTLDQRGLPTAMTDPNGATTRYAYDEAGQPAVTTVATVNAETNGGNPTAVHPVAMIGYDTFGAPTEVSDPNGNVTVTGFDAAGRPVTVTGPAYTPPGTSTPITPVSRTEYDDLGRVTKTIDPLGHATGTSYDQLGNVAAVTDADGKTTRHTYDTNRELLSTTGPTGARTEATYDGLGRKITETAIVRQPSPVANTTTLTYGDGGWLSTSTTPAGVKTSYIHNAVGEVTSVTDGAGNVTAFRYDAAGRKTVTVLADGSSQTVAYDGAGRAVATADLDPAGTVLRTTGVTYDANGNSRTVTDARGTVTTFSYDAANRLTGETQPTSPTESITIGFGYDAAGNRTRSTDGRGNPFITTYNSLNLPESLIEPATPAHPALAERTFTTGYDAAGRAVSYRAPGGVSVTTTYDHLNRITAQTGTGAEASTAERSFGWDDAGRLTSASAPGGSNTFTWDDRGLLLTTTGSSGAASFAYTSDGQMATRTDAAGTSTYTYDTAGRLRTLADASTATTLSYAYNSLSQPATITYGTGGDTRTFGYDNLHRLTSDTLKTPTGTTVAGVSYGYDLNDNTTTKTTTGFAGAATNTYGYDLANRLTSWTTGSTSTAYGYDAAGNRIRASSVTATYDARNRLISDTSGRSHTYTARGTLASTTVGAQTTTSTSDAFDQTITSGGRTYAYDALQRLVAATSSGGAGTTLAYSGLGNDVAADGTTTYSRDPGGALIGGKRGTSGTLAFTDRHTDVVGQFTATATSLSASTTYDPFGTVTATSGQASGLGYQSGWTDPNTGRVNMWSRWYNPGTGAFDNRDTATVDPVPNAVAANRYAYGDGNALTTTDPTGQYCAVCVAPAIEGAGAAGGAGAITGPGAIVIAAVAFVVLFGVAYWADQENKKARERANTRRKYKQKEPNVSYDPGRPSSSGNSPHSNYYNYGPYVEDEEPTLPGSAPKGPGNNPGKHGRKGDNRKKSINQWWPIRAQETHTPADDARGVPAPVLSPVPAQIGPADLSALLTGEDPAAPAGPRAPPPTNFILDGACFSGHWFRWDGSRSAGIWKCGERSAQEDSAWDSRASDEDSALLRSSSGGAPRRISPGGRPDGQIVFAGHGSHNLADGNFFVPEGTRVAVYARYGLWLSDTEGHDAEGGKPWMRAVKIYKSNESMPNFTLFPPVNLWIYANSKTVDKPTLLSELLEPGMGLCHWAACSNVYYREAN